MQVSCAGVRCVCRLVQRSGAGTVGEGRGAAKHEQLELVSMATMSEVYGTEANVGDQNRKPMGER